MVRTSIIMPLMVHGARTPHVPEGDANMLDVFCLSRFERQSL